MIPKTMSGYVDMKCKPSSGELLPENRYMIEYQVEVTPEEFEDIINNPLKDRQIIADHKDDMFTDDEGVWHCLLITAPGFEYGILVESEGYDYCRYAAIIQI